MSIPIDRSHRQHDKEGGEQQGGLRSSPIVANLTASPGGEGLTREELKLESVKQQKSTGQEGFLIHQFRQSLLLNLNVDVLPPISLPVYESMLLPEQSFHSILSTTFSLPTTHSNTDIPESFYGCAVLLIYHFPPSVILDPFQINQLHADGVLGDSVRFFGDIELELPFSRLSDRAREGSGLVLEINPFRQKKENKAEKGRNIRVDVPLHGRYLEPKRSEEEHSERTIEIEWPWVGLTCPISSFSTSLSAATSNTHYTLVVNLGPLAIPRIPGPFCPDLFSLTNQTLYPFQPASSISIPRPSGPLLVSMVLPVGDPSHLSFVEISTTIAVWLGAVWVGWCVLCRMRSSQDNMAKTKVE